MKAALYQVDAFADRVFEGNPAAVVPLESWPDDAMLQALAAENNLSETAFFVPEGDSYRLRWFTPAVEVPLCGHATLASAHVLFSHLGHVKPELHFETLSGRLTVVRDGDLLAMDFPGEMPKPYPAPADISLALGGKPLVWLKTSKLMAVFATVEEVAALTPDFAALGRIMAPIKTGIIATAQAPEGSEADFVSRYFAPAQGIDEDPVTGSAHCTLVPYWAKKLGKSDLVARQISKRGGTLYCLDAGERVIIRGRCADYMKAEISF
ncbi:MAG: PhzF family phenazine biosynthesis protein [Parvibaculum sp.]|uniref:PhzF family phenazine biosynthesis protein n=1 Tax=Parvibaculum sp. TaxID=2024848 RepID=UPI00271D861D|nr:PhzF family phenazine biosynthesis protein [Parvibaculum sp.]MDO8839413.1 PhzF family phenazine biosynthesis protein [Parvibaculum sp.]